MFTIIRRLLKHHLCCKYHKMLLEDYTSLTEYNAKLVTENTDLKRKLEQYLPSESHQYVNLQWQDTKTNTQVCVRCGESSKAVSLYRLKCETNYEKVYISTPKEVSREYIPLLTYRELCNKSKKAEGESE